MLHDLKEIAVLDYTAFLVDKIDMVMHSIVLKTNDIIQVGIESTVWAWFYYLILHNLCRFGRFVIIGFISSL